MTHEPTGYTSIELETVDQVNALPIGTVAGRVRRHETFWDGYDIYDAAIKDESGWATTASDAHFGPEDLIGWTAFIPAHHD
ncbi:hypothetical protein [Dermabacter hominis]|uniref:hypothetical protein n=1 Tax=Dermabacter hominis TaxID=36740 RepID=UPI0021A7B100|nr:hypothetical protein [Dermabacter hominis]MCT1790589.1 hypothetical protein [Dermabacter hominis]